MLGIGDALKNDPRVFVYGEDVGGQYGNAFLLLRPLLKDYGDRIRNSPLAEGAVLGVCVGAALAGLRPIGEMQFNDFVATGFNQLVNNAAKIRYRWGGEVPMVVRMPWGGLRHAGPYHSQNTEPWFYRTPGLKIVVPSTPEDARALMAAAVADPDPVLYYEHIALYRDPRIKQALPPDAPARCRSARPPCGEQGGDLAMISYGAYVHHCLRAADKLAAEGIEASVLDLRSLAPLDKDAILAVTRHCNRVLIVHEDSRTGGIGESLAAIIQEEAFEALDAPIRILGGARYAGALLASTRRVLPGQRGRYCEGRAAVEPVLDRSRCSITLPSGGMFHASCDSVCCLSCRVSWLSRRPPFQPTSAPISVSGSSLAARSASSSTCSAARARAKASRRWLPSRAIARRRCPIPPARSST